MLQCVDVGVKLWMFRGADLDGDGTLGTGVILVHQGVVGEHHHVHLDFSRGDGEQRAAMLAPPRVPSPLM